MSLEFVQLEKNCLVWEDTQTNRTHLKNRLQIYRIPETIQNFLQTEELLKPCYLSSRNSYTSGPLANTSIAFGKNPSSNLTLKFSYSEFHCEIIW